MVNGPTDTNRGKIVFRTERTWSSENSCLVRSFVRSFGIRANVISDQMSLFAKYTVNCNRGFLYRKCLF